MRSEIKTPPLWVVPSLCAITLLPRLFLLLVGERHFQTFEYEVIANNILAGSGFGLEHYGTWYKTFGSPPFSFLCALVYKISGHSSLLLMGVQACFSLITVMGCYSLGRRMFSVRVGFLAGVLAALHPGLLFYDTHKIHPLSFDAALATSGILMIVAMRGRESWRRSIQAGLLHGLAIFERSTFVGLFFLTLFSCARRKNGASLLRVVVPYVISVGVVFSPWVVRNIFLFRRPVVVTTTSAEVFWRGNNSIATGGAYAPGKPGEALFDAAPEEFRARILGKPELTQSQIFARAAMEFITEHPMRALTLYGKKLVAFCWFAPDSGYFYPPIYLVIYKFYYSVVLICSFVGMAAVCRGMNESQRWTSLFVIYFMIGVALLQSSFYVEIRHRWGIEPLLLICAAQGALCLKSRLSRNPRC